MSDSDVKDRPPVEILPPTPKKKSKLAEPSKWHVVFQQDVPFLIGCSVVVIADVFNKSVDEAFEHVLEASMIGKSSVLVASRDIVETKTDQANEKVLDHRAHNPDMISVCFKAERMP